MIQDRIIQNLVLPSNISSLSKLEAFIDELCEQYTIDEDNYGNILIALTEAVNNAITHGNKLRPDKMVLLSFGGNSKQIEFTITDEGNGFDYNNIPDPTHPENLEKVSGRGVFLMRSLADNIVFENNGNIIKLTFSISAN
jgi:serine/threonine-protein kinase RsbW